MSDSSPQKRSDKATTLDLATKLGLSLGLLLSVVMIAAGPSQSTGYLLQTIGLGLLASVSYAAIFLTVSARHNDDYQRAVLEAAFADLKEDLRKDQRDRHARYLPLAEYLPADTPSSNFFNQDIAESILASRTYEFVGSSAKYVAPRILRSSNAISRVRLVVLHPFDDPLTQARVRDRLLLKKYSSRTFSQLAQELRAESLASLVSLFDLRYRCQIEIALSRSHSTLQRIELFDEDVYVSLQAPVLGHAADFPLTERYARGSRAYALARAEIDRLFDLSWEDVRFQAADTDEDLVRMLGEIGFDDCDEEDLGAIRTRTREFGRDFETKLRTIERTSGRHDNRST